jgi:hypothetical protein
VAALKVGKPYGKGSRTEFSQLLTDILANIDKYKVAKQIKALGKISPGGRITGGTSGSIGGFLINNNKEIFLFGDAHVMTKTMSVAVGKVTPQTQVKDKITKNNVEIGVVVCSSHMQIGGNQNYDMALAKIDPSYYKDISVQYQGRKASKDFAKSRVVTKVDENLFDGKLVYLYGHDSGYKEGKLLTSTPGDVSDAPYDKFIGASTSQNITMHGCIQVKSVKDHTVTREGDSGGLWVNDNGEAVGIQVMIASDASVGWIHLMRLVMDYFHNNYDGTLRFLTANDLPKHTVP